MEIDEKLIKYKTEVGEHLDEIENFKTQLSSDMTTLTTTNNNNLGTLNTLFKSNAGTSVNAQIEYINQTINKINKSLESELGSTLSECKALYSGIKELEGILSSYNSKVSQLNGLKEDDPSRGSLRSEISKLEAEFKAKHSEMCQKHDSLINKDGQSPELKEYTIPENPADSTTPGLDGKYKGSDKTTSIFYEVDGVIYQKVLPYYLSDGGLGASYTIAYDKNAILNAVGSNSKIGQQAISFLNSKLNGGNASARLWMFNKRYSNQEYADIAKVMDTVLEASYVANGCKSVSDHATVAAMVATNSLVYLTDSGRDVANTKGFHKLVNIGGCNCIEFTAWTYYQGLAQVYKLGDRADVALKGVTIAELASNGTDFRKMSPDELLKNLKPGTILTRYGSGSGHTGTVLGVSKNQSGKYEVIVAESKPTAGAITLSRWTLQNLKNDWSKILTTDMMTKRAVEGSCK